MRSADPQASTHSGSTTSWLCDLQLIRALCASVSSALTEDNDRLSSLGGRGCGED